MHDVVDAVHPADLETLRVAVRVLRLQTRSDCCQLLIRLRDAYDGLQPSLHGELGLTDNRTLLGNPDVRCPPGITLRRDANDCAPLVIQRDDTSDHRRVSCEVFPPGRLAEYGYRRRVRRSVLRLNHAPELSGNSDKLECVWRNRCQLQPRRIVTFVEQSVPRFAGYEPFEQAGRLFKHALFFRRNRPAPPSVFRLVQVKHGEHHKPVAMRIRKRVQQHAPNITVAAPMPSESANTASAVNPGAVRNVRLP